MKTPFEKQSSDIPDATEVKAILLRQMAESAKYKLLYGQEYGSSDYVFLWPDGRPFTPDYVSRKFSRELEIHKLPHIRYHDLRHTTASILIAKGFQIKDIRKLQVQVGHPVVDSAPS